MMWGKVFHKEKFKNIKLILIVILIYLFEKILDFSYKLKYFSGKIFFSINKLNYFFLKRFFFN
jgi:hypothetical protein